MADTRLKGPKTRWYVAAKEAFADWTQPTSAELNNTAGGLVTNITCAVNQDGSNFDLADPDTDDSLTFCQRSGTTNATTQNVDIAIEVETSAVKNVVNTATKAHSLLRWPGVEYFFIMSVGESPDEPFDVGHEIKMASAETDWGVDVAGTGENIRLSQTPLARGDINWGYKLAA